jgi:hypothetical protein
MRVLLARWRRRPARLPTLVVERDLLATSGLEPRRVVGLAATADRRRPACAADGAGTDSPRKGSEALDRSTGRAVGGHGTQASSDVEELLLRIRGLVFARAILEQRGASEVDLEEHRLEIERLRWHLASLIRAAPTGLPETVATSHRPGAFLLQLHQKATRKGGGRSRRETRGDGVWTR